MKTFEQNVIYFLKEGIKDFNKEQGISGEYNINGEIEYVRLKI